MAANPKDLALFGGLEDVLGKPPVVVSAKTTPDLDLFKGLEDVVGPRSAPTPGPERFTDPLSGMEMQAPPGPALVPQTPRIAHPLNDLPRDVRPDQGTGALTPRSVPTAPDFGPGKVTAPPAPKLSLPSPATFFPPSYSAVPPSLRLPATFPKRVSPPDVEPNVPRASETPPEHSIQAKLEQAGVPRGIAKAGDIITRGVVGPGLPIAEKIMGKTVEHLQPAGVGENALAIVSDLVGVLPGEFGAAGLGAKAAMKALPKMTPAVARALHTGLTFALTALVPEEGRNYTPEEIAKSMAEKFGEGLAFGAPEALALKYGGREALAKAIGSVGGGGIAAAMGYLQGAKPEQYGTQGIIFAALPWLHKAADATTDPQEKADLTEKINKLETAIGPESGQPIEQIPEAQAGQVTPTRWRIDYQVKQEVPIPGSDKNQIIRTPKSITVEAKTFEDAMAKARGILRDENLDSIIFPVPVDPQDSSAKPKPAERMATQEEMDQVGNDFWGTGSETPTPTETSKPAELATSAPERPAPAAEAGPGAQAPQVAPAPAIDLSRGLVGKTKMIALATKAREIIQKGDAGDYEYYGIRLDDREFQPGEEIPDSYVWNDGEKTDEILPGVSVIGLTKYDWNLYLDYAEDIGGYDYNRAYLVGGNTSVGNSDFGDPGEIVIEDGRVLERLDSTPTKSSPAPAGETPLVKGGWTPPQDTHRRKILDALTSGDLSPADYARLHESTYGPLAEFAPDVAKQGESTTDKNTPTWKQLFDNEKISGRQAQTLRALEDKTISIEQRKQYESDSNSTTVATFSNGQKKWVTEKGDLLELPHWWNEEAARTEQGEMFSKRKPSPGTVGIVHPLFHTLENLAKRVGLRGKEPLFDPKKFPELAQAEELANKQDRTQEALASGQMFDVESELGKDVAAKFQGKGAAWLTAQKLLTDNQVALETMEQAIGETLGVKIGSMESPTENLAAYRHLQGTEKLWGLRFGDALKVFNGGKNLTPELYRKAQIFVQLKSFITREQRATTRPTEYAGKQAAGYNARIKQLKKLHADALARAGGAKPPNFREYLKTQGVDPSLEGQLQKLRKLQDHVDALQEQVAALKQKVPTVRRLGSWEGFLKKKKIDKESLQRGTPEYMALMREYVQAKAGTAKGQASRIKNMQRGIGKLEAQIEDLKAGLPPNPNIAQQGISSYKIEWSRKQQAAARAEDLANRIQRAEKLRDKWMGVTMPAENVNPEGVTAQLAQKQLDQMRKAIGGIRYAQFEKGARELARVWHEALLYMLKGDLISRETYDAVNAEAARTGDYLGPFRILEHVVKELQDRPSPGVATRSVSISGQTVVQHMQGTTKLNEPIFSASILKIAHMVHQVEQNRVAQSVYRLRNLGPDVADVIKDAEMVEIGGKQFYKINGEITDTVLPHGFSPINFLAAGEKRTFLVPTPVADVLTGAFGQVETDLMIRLFRASRNLLRVTATSASPTFIATNFPRDIGTNLVSAEYPLFLGTDFYKDFSRVGRAYLAVLTEGNKGMRESLGQWYASGGSHTTRSAQYGKRRLDLKSAQEIEAKRVAGLSGIERREKLGATLETVMGPMESTEGGIRLAIFDKAKGKYEEKYGVSAPSVEDLFRTGFEHSEAFRPIFDAGGQSRNATVDFSKGGDVTKSLNTGAPFVNAPVQGMITVAKGAREHPTRFLFLAAAAAAIGVEAWNFNHRTKEIADAEDDMTQSFKDGYFHAILYVNHDAEGNPLPVVVSVRKPEWVQAVTSIPTEFLDWYYQRGGQTGKSAALNVVSNFSPWQFTTNQGEFNPSRLFSVLAPTMIAAPFEVQGRGYDPYRDQEIVSDTMMDRRPEERLNAGTSLGARWLGEKTGTAPVKWDYFAGRIAASPGRYLLRAPELIAGSPPDTRNLTWEEKATRLPLVPGFFRSMPGRVKAQAIHRALDVAEQDAGSERFETAQKTRPLVAKWPSMSEADRTAAMADLKRMPGAVADFLSRQQVADKGQGAGNEIFRRISMYSDRTGERAEAIAQVFRDALKRPDQQEEFYQQLRDRDLLTPGMEQDVELRMTSVNKAVPALSPDYLRDKDAKESVSALVRLRAENKKQEYLDLLRQLQPEGANDANRLQAFMEHNGITYKQFQDRVKETIQETNYRWVENIQAFDGLLSELEARLNRQDILVLDRMLPEQVAKKVLSDPDLLSQMRATIGPYAQEVRDRGLMPGDFVKIALRRIKANRHREAAD